MRDICPRIPSQAKQETVPMIEFDESGLEGGQELSFSYIMEQEVCV